jgi:hypothetical protein
MAKRYGHISENVLRDAISVLARMENLKASPELRHESKTVAAPLPS